VALNWQRNISDGLNGDLRSAGEKNVEGVEFFAECGDCSDQAVRSAVGECIDKAVEVLASNLRDDSMYFMCEWNAQRSSLTIVVTDEFKTNDSACVVTCRMSMWSNQMQALRSDSVDIQGVALETCESTVKYWAADYLTTCSAFLQYSLIAVFYSGSRTRTALL